MLLVALPDIFLLLFRTSVSESHLLGTSLFPFLNTRTETSAVKKDDDRTNEITNKRGGKVTQVIVNVLSPDGSRIDNTYKNYNEKGELTTTTTAVYERMR